MGYETAYTENVGSNDMEAVFRSYCEEGYDFVIGHGAQYGDACCRVAEDYPNVNFFITGATPPRMYPRTSCPPTSCSRTTVSARALTSAALWPR